MRFRPCLIWCGISNGSVTETPSRRLLQGSLDRLMELANVLGLLYREEETDLDSEIEALIEKRAQARKNRDWATADAIRDELRARHVVLEDTPQGCKMAY